MEDSWRSFEKRFDFQIPGDATKVSGTLEITADNSYTAYFNGARVGADSDIQSVETWSLDPVEGVNTLKIVVKNVRLLPGVIAANPTGVIYKLTVGYEVPPASLPTPSSTATPTPSSTPTPSLAPTPTPQVHPSATQPTRTPAPASGDGGSVNSSKVIGIVFFGFVDVLLIGLFVYLIWRFFIHPRAEQP